jgi:tripartite-type tricarboxylate transporter receptor subunit TctC
MLSQLISRIHFICRDKSFGAAQPEQVSQNGCPSAGAGAVRLAFSMAGALAIVAVAGATTGSAQNYPSRPIKMIVPFAAGGPTDAIARIISERMRSPLDQPVIVENIAGADGGIAVGRVIRSAPDGYTIGIGNIATHVLNGEFYSLQYDLLGDLEPIALLVSAPALIVTNKSMPPNDLRGLITWLKDNPGKGSAGVFATWSRVFGVHLQNTTGATFQLVPYRGAAPAMLDLMAGHINIMFDQAGDALPHLQNGDIKAFAVAARSRLQLAPDVPTVDEAGLPGFYLSIWHGLWAPKGTPKAVIAKLNSAVAVALADPVARRQLIELGQEITPPDQQAPEQLHALQQADADKWWPIMKQANIKAP